MNGVLVNGEPWEPGCYVDGHWGQYALGRAIELARSVGFVVDDAGVAVVDADAAACNGTGDPLDADQYEALVWLADEAEAFLNDATVGGSWLWQDGELFLEADEDPDEDPVVVRNRAVPVPNVYGCHDVEWRGWEWSGTGEPPDGGEHVHGSSLRKVGQWSDPLDVFGVELPVTWGDYTGSTCERANYGWLLETYGPDVFIHVRWDFGTSGLVLPYSADPDTFAAVLEDVAGLADYPLFSDDALSALEYGMTVDTLRWWLQEESEWDDAFPEGVEDDGERLALVVRAYFDGPAHDDPIVFESAVEGYITPSARATIGELLTRVGVDQ